MKPDDFWNSTFDEVLLVIKGKVDDWRIQRSFAYSSTMFGKSIPTITDYCPLPYDYELNTPAAEDPTDMYNQASQELANFTWPVKASKN